MKMTSFLNSNSNFPLVKYLEEKSAEIAKTLGMDTG